MIQARKIIVYILIISVLAVQAQPVFAQFSALSNKVPVQDSDVKNALVGKTSCGILNPTACTSALDTFTKAIDTVKNFQCVTADVSKVLNAADNINTWTFGGLSLLGGNSSEVTMITNKMKVLNDTKTCVVEKKLKELEKQKPDSILAAQYKQIAMDEVTKEKNTIDLRLDGLNQQLRTAQTGLWKGILTASLIKITKSMAQLMVAKLTAKFKVNQYTQYADALASQIYTAQMINQYGGTNQERLLAYSLIKNPLVGGQIDPTVRVIAQRNLGYELNNVDFRDPQFGSLLLKAGAAEADPSFMQMVYNDQATQFQAQAMQASLREVNMGNGLKTPYSCAGVLATQQTTMKKLQLARDKVENRANLFAELDAAQRAGKKVPQEDLQKAYNDEKKAEEELDALPNSFKSPVEEPCKFVASPASMVDKAINQAFAAYSEQFKNYNNNNLPFVTNIISDIASGLTTNMIFGNAGGVKNTLISETGNLALLGDLATGMASANYNTNKFANGIEFDQEAISGGQYKLTWTVLDNSDAYTVKLTGPGIPTNSTVPLPLNNGSYVVSPTQPGNYTYTLNFYDSKGMVVASKTQTINYNTANSGAPSDGGSACGGNYASYCDCVIDIGDESACKAMCGVTSNAPVCGTVSGAFISKPSPLQPRGQIEKITIR